MFIRLKKALNIFAITALVVSAAGLGQAVFAASQADVFIVFENTPGPSEQALVKAQGGKIKYSYTLVPAIAASLSEQAVSALSKNPKVKAIEPDGIVYAIDAELDNTWGVKRIGAGTVHGSGNKGTGVKVAIIDSGIDYTHPDLDANFFGGYDFVNSDSDSLDDNGHGTHVAGTVAAEDNDTGVVGAAPQAKLYALKVLNSSGSGSWSNVIAALQWAVENAIQVTNNSYGSGSDPGSTVKAAFDNSAAAGIFHAAAAGNSGNCAGKGNNVGYPARYASVIAVAATNQDDTRPCFSSTGPTVELAAPGVKINSTKLGGGYVEFNGTSMASPHVAGTAALVIAAGITDSNGDGKINDEVRKRLQETADDLGSLGKDNQYGYGLVDADEAAILPVANIVPSANDLSASTNEDTAVGITLSGSDAESCELTFSIVSGPSNGTLGAITDNGCVSGSPNTDSASITYTPNLNFNDSDSFTYKVNDGSVDSNIATASITVNAVNDKPVADNKSVSTEKNTAVAITLTGSDVDGCNASTSFAVMSGPANGVLSATGGSMSCSGGNLSANVNYSPNTDFVGDDAFAFHISDGTDTSNEATVSIAVTATNTAPSAAPVSATTNEDTPVSITLSGADAESCELNFTVVTGPANGTLGSLANQPCTSGTPNLDTAQITYTPNANFNGSDSFTYKVNDGSADSNTATVSITVNPVNDTPAADNKAVTTQKDTAVAVTLSGSDVETCELTFSTVTGPSSGSLSAITDNACAAGSPNADKASITYTPNAGFTGSDSFTYKVNDGLADSNTATVSVTVTSPVLLSENFEGDVSAWSASGLWHLANDTPCVTPGYKSATHSFYYGKESSCNYDTGKKNTGALTSPSVSGLGSSIKLSFWYWREVESYNGAYDKTSVQVSYDGGSTWTTVWYKDSKNASEKEWTFASLDLTSGSDAVKVRFAFDSVDGVANKFRGWLVDDVTIENN
ncbi:MAG: S8 family serine peptidase [Candidatus Doudnabacteria bacterium]|nr:S8 family serine peptidase [Candidatus Doudnabacteria bacterium]